MVATPLFFWCPEHSDGTEATLHVGGGREEVGGGEKPVTVLKRSWGGRRSWEEEKVGGMGVKEKNPMTMPCALLSCPKFISKNFRYESQTKMWAPFC